MNKRPTRLYFDLDIWKWLKAEARRLRCSISEIVRRLILAEITRRRNGK